MGKESIYNACLEITSYLGKYSNHISNLILSKGMKTCERNWLFCSSESVLLKQFDTQRELRRLLLFLKKEQEAVESMQKVTLTNLSIIGIEKTEIEELWVMFYGENHLK